MSDIKKDTDKNTAEVSQTESKKTQVGKYITQMKELPPETEDEESKTEVRQPRSQVITKTEEKPEVKVEPQVKPENGAEKDDEDEGKSKLPLSSKDILLGVINLITIVLLIVILTKFPQKAEELKTLRNESLMSATTVTYEFAEIEESKTKADELNNLFLEESGVVSFVNEIEKIKAKGESSIVKPTFTSQKAVKDRTGSFGVPIVIEMQGSWETISRDIQEIDKLPFLFRPASAEVNPDKDDPSVIHFKYGILLYVIDRLGQDR